MVERTFDRHVAAPDGGRLTVNLDVGAASVVGSDTHEVTVHARLRGTDQFLSELSIEVRQDASGVQVVERSSHPWEHWFWFGGPEVSFTIDVPRDYPVMVRTSGGSLTLRNLHASAEGTTAGGSIVVHDIQGTVNVHTLGGSIDAERIEGPAQLHTAGGPIHVYDVRGDVNAHTMGGSIDLVRVDGKIRAETMGGSVSADELGDQDVSLQTAGGSIILRVPATIHASLDASTLGGSVSSAIPLTSTQSADHSRLLGTINGTDHTIRLHTSGGSIRVEPQA
jgi:DUF4097 and DUF4098 domain-containing protein YvlB